jgi:hypothetical protein
MVANPHSPEYYANLDKMELFADDKVLAIARGETTNFIKNFGSKQLVEDLSYSQSMVDNNLKSFFIELFQIMPTATVVETDHSILFFKQFQDSREKLHAYMVGVVEEEGQYKIANIEANMTPNLATEN